MDFAWDKMDKNTIAGYADDFIKKCEKGIIKRAEGTIETYRSSLNHIIGFEHYTGKTFRFKDVGKDFYYTFTAYLRSERKLSESTVGKVINKLKTFISEADEDEIEVNFNHKKKYLVN